MTAEGLSEQLVGTPAADWVREIRHFEETSSTNEIAMQLGQAGEPGGLLVLAETQTSGRGRFGRRWESAAGRGLWLSLLLRPEFPMEHWSRLTTWAAVSVAAAVERVAPVRAEIKWPNDVQIGGRKVAGILAEVGRDAARQSFAVLGIGLNVNQATHEFPAELRELATSLRIAGGVAINRTDLTVALLIALHDRWRLLANGFDTLVHEAARRSSLLGSWVQVQTGDGLLEGVAERLDEEGHLWLQPATGPEHKLVAGEVTLRKF